MDIERIRIISLVIFAVSLAGILYMKLSYLPPSMHPSEVRPEMEGRYVTLFGAITSVKHSEKATFIKLDGFPVVFFANISASRGELARIYGRLQKYHGRMELIGMRIIKS